MNPEKGGPALVEVAIKGFPWPASVFDPGAAAAALAFNLLLVFAFLVPTRSMVSTIVREKELRLREGMRIFGLQVPPFPLLCGPPHALSSASNIFPGHPVMEGVPRP
jgi:hypothetical protein